MPEAPVCMGGALECSELLDMLNSGLAIAAVVGMFACFLLGQAFVKALA